VPPELLAIIEDANLAPARSRSAGLVIRQSGGLSRDENASAGQRLLWRLMSLLLGAAALLAATVRIFGREE